MTDKRLPEITNEVTQLARADLLYGVDVSDTSEHSTGTGFKMQAQYLFPFVDVGQYAAGDGVTDDTANLDAAYAAGKTIVFPAGTYLTDGNVPQDGTTIIMNGDVILKRRAEGTNPLIYYLNKSDIHVYANGAKFDSSATPTGSSNHTISFLGATRCTLRDAWVFSAPDNTKDGVYFGLGNSECRDCGVIGGKIEASKRNGISAVAQISCYAIGVEIFDVTGSPGWGVDVEANNHSYENRQFLVRGCRIHDCQNAGIGVSFGDQSIIENNECYDNGTNGISVGSGGNTRSSNFWRANVDVMGVSAFDQANGWITVGGDLNLLPIGMPVQISPQNGESNPGGLSTNVYVVCEHNGATQIRVGAAVEESVITSFSGAETGTGNTDPSLSDYILNVYGGEGQSNRSRVIGNTCYRNGSNGIYVALTDHTIVDGNKCFNNTEEQMYLESAFRSTVINNECWSDTPVNYAGILMVRCHKSKIDNNDCYNIGYVGLNIVACSYAKITDNTADNCGENGTGVTSANMRLASSARVKFSGNSARNAESYGATSYGLYTSDLTVCHFTDNIFRNAGPDNANSFVIGEAGHFFSNNVKYDGTEYVYS